MEFDDDDGDLLGAANDDQNDDDAEGMAGAGGAGQHKKRSYSLAVPSACTALCVMCELIYQRGFDIIKVADVHFETDTDTVECMDDESDNLGVCASALSQEAGVQQQYPVHDDAYSIPRPEMLESTTEKPRCAPAPRPLDDTKPVQFPRNVKLARDALRALGDKGIMIRTIRIPNEPLIVAKITRDVCVHSTAYIHGCKRGDVLYVFAPCAEPKVLVKTTRSIIAKIQETVDELAASGNVLYESIIVHNGYILPYARKDMAVAKHDYNIHISEFGVYELQANPTSHSLVPLHVPVTLEQVAEKMSGLGIKPENVPVVYEDDVIAKCLGLRPGDFVRIRRNGYEGASEVVFRKVVHKNIKHRDKTTK